MNITDISHLRLNIDIDLDKLKSEMSILNESYKFENYHSIYFVAKRKYKKSWSGVALYGTNGELYDDFYEGLHNSGKPILPTELKSKLPYMYEVIDKVYGDSPTTIVRLMRIAPKSSLLWHSHVQEHKQSESELIIQIPIEMPTGFKYCVVNKDEFKWWKRFNKPNSFKSLSEFEMEEGNAYYFNSYHYHNVYNPSNQYRTALMFYVNSQHPYVDELLKSSIEKENEKKLQKSLVVSN